MIEIKEKEQICAEIEEFVNFNEGEYSDYYIGITNTPSRRLVEENELLEHIDSGKLTDENYYLANAWDNKTAVSIEILFQKLGMHEYNPESKGKNDSIFVYCFKIADASITDKEKTDLKSKIRSQLRLLNENNDEN